MKKKQNAYQEVQAWFATKMAGRSSFTLPVLVKQAVTHFAKDHNFLRRFAKDFLYRAFYELAISALSQARGPRDLMQTPMHLRSLKPSVWTKWDSHLEHVGSQYISLPELTPTLWRVARAERAQRIDSEGRAISFCDTLLARCSPRQKVRHCWQPEEVDVLWKKLHPKEDVA